MVPLRLRHLLSATLLALLALAAPPRPAAAQRAEAAPEDDIVVVANPAVPVSSLSTSDARRVFLMRTRFWPHGERVAPVNLPAASPVRQRFSVALLGRTVRELGEYWNDLYFHGTEPPRVLDSERAVLLYVARTPGAIGYVRGATLRAAAERDRVKVLLTLTP
jgi:hypothetical protein